MNYLDEYIGFVYIWENQVTNKKYIGMHIGKVDDGYIGSGVYFIRAIKKYGIENFNRTILYFEYENAEKLYQKEFDTINEYNAVHDDSFYNLTNTDPKSFNFISGKIERKFTSEHKKNISASAKLRIYTEETKSIMSKNSHIKGKKWYNNGEISKVFFQGNEPEGWSIGRLKVSTGNMGYKTYNNGIQEKQFPKDVIMSKEWVLGRLPGNIKRGPDNYFYGKVHSNNSKNKMRQTKIVNGSVLRGSKNPASIAVTIDGVEYATIKEAMICTGMSYANIRNRRTLDESN